MRNMYFAVTCLYNKAEQMKETRGIDISRTGITKESVDGMNICPNGTYVDVTSVVEGIPVRYFRVWKKTTFIRFDQDEDAERKHCR